MLYTTYNMYTMVCDDVMTHSVIHVTTAVTNVGIRVCKVPRRAQTKNNDNDTNDDDDDDDDTNTNTTNTNNNNNNDNNIHNHDNNHTTNNVDDDDDDDYNGLRRCPRESGSSPFMELAASGGSGTLEEAALLQT